MSYFGSWPSYKISKFRGVGELGWKLLRLSWRVDRILVPMTLPVLLFLHFFANKLPSTPMELENPYIEAYKVRKEEGKYNGVVIGLRPEKYV